MQIDRLAALIERPEVMRKILKDYAGGYSLGITSDPRDRDQFAIRVRIEGDDPGDIPSEVELDGETIPVLVNTRFKVPEPLARG